MIVAPGATSVSVDVFFADDTGAAVTGKVAADFPACKWSGGANTADTTITLSDLAAITTAHPNDNTAGGVKEREGGVYRFDLPNNMFTSAGRKTLTFAETTNKRILVQPIDVQYVQSNAMQVNSDATAAANLATQFNGGVLAGDTYPSTQLQVKAIGVTSSPQNKVGADSATITTGTATGTVANTKGNDGSYYAIADVAGTTDFYLEFDLSAVTSAQADNVQIIGYVAGAANTITVSYYDFVSAAWVVGYTWKGQAGTTNNEPIEIPVDSVRGTGTSGTAGKVRVRFNGTGLTSSSVKIDQITCGYGVVPATASLFPAGFSTLTISGGLVHSDLWGYRGSTPNALLSNGNLPCNFIDVTNIVSSRVSDSLFTLNASESTQAGMCVLVWDTSNGSTGPVPGVVVNQGGQVQLLGSTFSALTNGDSLIVEWTSASLAVNGVGQPTAAALAVQAKTDVQAALTTQGYTTTRAGYLDTLNGLVQAIWDKATSALTTAGSIGKLLVDNVNTAMGGIAAAVWAVGSRTLTAFGFNVTVGTNNDKTGYTLTVTPPTAAQIDTQLTGTHGTGSWQTGSGGGGGGGNINLGDTVVTSNTSGPGGSVTTDYFKVEQTASGPPVSNAQVIAYLTSDYTTNPATAIARGFALSIDDGTWSGMMLNAGLNYTIIARGPDGRTYGPKTLQL